jgi:hypothetical protein
MSGTNMNAVLVEFIEEYIREHTQIQKESAHAGTPRPDGRGA